MGLILLVDMDYFFAACEESRHPELKSKPLVVGTAPVESKEHGVVQTCNYIAREFGIRSAISVANALKLNPNLVYVHSDESFYEQMSIKVMSIVRSYGLRMEALSIDEVAIEYNGDDYESAMELAKSIKERINGELKLPCTIGISTSKVYAKMVCDANKPDRIGMVKKDELLQFMHEKDVGTILGVGPKTRQRLEQIGVKTIYDLSRVDATTLLEMFGKFGGELRLIALGEDTSGVLDESEAISIGRERTIGDTSDISTIGKAIMELTDETFVELKKKNLRFGAVGAKVRYQDFSVRTRIKKLSKPSDSKELAYNTCMSLIESMLSGRKVRKVGIRLAGLEHSKGQKRL